MKERLRSITFCARKFAIRGVLGTHDDERLAMRPSEARGLFGIEDANVDPLQRMDEQETLCRDEACPLENGEQESVPIVRRGASGAVSCSE